jgi:hypothetical protein
MRWIVVLVVVVSGLVGCGKSNPPEQASPPKGSPAAAKTPDHPAAHAAHRFMTAMVKGDVEGANKLITPTALRQFEAAKQTFVSAEGMGSAQFTIDKLEQTVPEEMVVKCVFTVENAQEQMCCWMRHVEGRWLVRGIIGEVLDDKNAVVATVVYDFEGASPMTPITLNNQSYPAASGTQAPQSAMNPAGNPVQ